MKYREYGNTGKQVSILGFGGMRFADPGDLEGSAETVLHSYKKGVNYFDTAPGYCENKSEDIMGLAISEMKKGSSPFYVSTKSSQANGDALRAQLEASLKRLGVDKINFFHCWCLLTLDAWEERKKGGAVKAILKAKEEGLIEHAVFSTHLPGSEIRLVMEEGFFEGVTLGYSAINAAFRKEGIQAAAEYGMGVVTMNPLGGGVIPGNAGRFSFLQLKEHQSNIIQGSLHYIWSTPGVSTAIVGMRNKKDVDQAAEAAENFIPYTPKEMALIDSKVHQGLDTLCTSCKYCDLCPVEIPVWKFMESANYTIIEGESPLIRLKYHWGASVNLLDQCTKCRACEEACTQHIPILERFETLKKMRTGAR